MIRRVLAAASRNPPVTTTGSLMIYRYMYVWKRLLGWVGKTAQVYLGRSAFRCECMCSGSGCWEENSSSLSNRGCSLFDDEVDQKQGRGGRRKRGLGDHHHIHLELGTWDLGAWDQRNSVDVAFRRETMKFVGLVRPVENPSTSLHLPRRRQNNKSSPTHPFTTTPIHKDDILPYITAEGSL